MPAHHADAARIRIAEAWAADAPDRRVALAREALALDPEATDAYVILARDAGDPAGRIALLREGVATGRRRWAAEIARPGEHPFWIDEDTQPFMRAVHDLAWVLWETGAEAEAVALLEDLLALNEDDHQGARYVALSWHAARGDWPAVERLLARYEEDQGADFLYALALDEFRCGGADADLLLEEAIDANPHVPGFLLCATTLPLDQVALEGDWGSPEEAAAYARHARAAWENVPGAFDWLVDAWAVVGGPDETDEPDAVGPPSLIVLPGHGPGAPDAPEPRGFVPVRADPKIARNDPCPCGSGRKYKHCCGAL